jgi:hypothetical protein
LVFTEEKNNHTLHHNKPQQYHVAPHACPKKKGKKKKDAIRRSNCASYHTLSIIKRQDALYVEHTISHADKIAYHVRKSFLLLSPSLLTL